MPPSKVSVVASCKFALGKILAIVADEKVGQPLEESFS